MKVKYPYTCHKGKGIVEVRLHSFLISTLVFSEYSASLQQL